MQKKLSLKYMKLGAAISILLLTGVLAHSAADFLNFKYSIVVSFISLGTAIFATLNLFLWHLPIIRYFYEFPDMRGTYDGSLNFLYRNEHNVEITGTMRTRREISQNGYGVFIKTTILKEDSTVSSISTAYEANVFVEDDNTVKLEFTYTNEGDPIQNSPPHQGTETLRFNKKDGTLTGSYYTNRTPFQTKGTISLTKIK